MTVIHYKTISTIKPFNLSIPSHSYFVVRTLKSYYLRELQEYNTALLTTIAILYIGPRRIHLITGSWFPSPASLHSCPSTSGNHPFTLCPL
jgi:hypothetical protein